MTALFAITTRGLEPISAAEVAALPGVADIRTGYRRVQFTTVGPLSAALGLRTVDDMFLDVATWEGIGRPRATLQRLWQLAAELELEPFADRIAALRELFRPPVFSVTASFVGKRNYSADEIKGEIAEGIVRRHGWSYEPDDALADLNVRLFIEHETAYVGLRLGQKPLQERRWKRAHRLGSLKPPVAAAMLRLAGLAPGQIVLDPFAGAGTIAVEAALGGAVARGGDHDPEAVQAARANAAAADVAAALDVWDARQLPLADGSVDGVVSNLPWGRQVMVDAELAALYGAALGEMRRVLRPGGHAVLLTSLPDLLDGPGWELVQRIEISLFGQAPSIVVLRAAEGGAGALSSE